MSWHGPIQPRPGERLAGFNGVPFDPPLTVRRGAWLYAADDGHSLMIEERAWGGPRRNFVLSDGAWRPG